MASALAKKGRNDNQRLEGNLNEELSTMTVSTLATIAANLSRAPINQANKASAALSGLFNLNRNASNNAPQDSTNLSAAISLQNQVAQFRVAAQNVAQASSLLAAAEQGAGGITKDLAKLKEITVRAQDASISNEERESLTSQFNTIRSRIDQTARSAKFSNEALLDGSSAQLKLASENKNIKDLTIGSLTDDALFKGRTLNIATQAGAKAAEAAVKEAQAYANTQLANIKELQEGLGYAAATLSAAIQNQEASSSTLDDTDFTTILLGGASPLQGNNIDSLWAQTNRLPPSMLQLLQE